LIIQIDGSQFHCDIPNVSFWLDGTCKSTAVTVTLYKNQTTTITLTNSKPFSTLLASNDWSPLCNSSADDDTEEASVDEKLKHCLELDKNDGNSTPKVIVSITATVRSLLK